MTDCERCAVSKPDPVPYLTHEKDMARMERMNFHQFFVIIVLIVALVASNLGWIVYESQFEEEVTRTEIDQDTNDGGNNYIVGGDYNGASESGNNQADANP